MNNLLANAVYTAHYTKKRPLDLTPWEQLRQLKDRLLEEHDAIPLAGITAGLTIGALVIVLIISVWYLCLQRRRRRNPREEYVNLLSIVARNTSDNSQYKRRPPKKPSLWTQLLQKSRPVNPLPKINGPACYLLYETDNSGQLVQFYSATPLDLNEQRNVVAIWKPAGHISNQKFTENSGRTVLMTNCTIGFQGKHNYCKGICQFLKAAFPSGGGTIILLKDAPIATDIYLYLNDTRPQYQTFSLEIGKTGTLPSNSLAVACVPQKSVFHKNIVVDMYQWLEDGERLGCSIRF